MFIGYLAVFRYILRQIQTYAKENTFNLPLSLVVEENIWKYGGEIQKRKIWLAVLFQNQYCSW